MIQIDIQIPKSCDGCPLCNEYYICQANDNDVEDYWDNSIKPKWCPLREVNECKADDCISRVHVCNLAYDMSEIDGEHYNKQHLVVDVDDIRSLPSVYPKTDNSVLEDIKAEIEHIEINGQIDEHTAFIRTGEQVKRMCLDIIDSHISGKENP